uniref:Uncharacterized protein n=1 Tax=Ralstonia syzygii R24 TaxID=907261 RepID=G3ACL2_9RALS|nr:hypothetical protein RALSY_mp30632 [Ralstonia syzygii R24]
MYAIGILAQDQHLRPASQGNSQGTAHAANRTNTLSESSDTGFGSGVIEVVTQLPYRGGRCETDFSHVSAGDCDMEEVKKQGVNRA